MPTVSHVWSTALVTSTSGLASETRNINNYTERSTLLSGTGHRPDLPQKGTQTIKPEWVVTFGAMIAFLVVIITVLMLVVIKLAKTNEQTTELSGETNYYENIQTYGKLNKL